MLLFYVQSSRLADMPESMSAPRKGTQTCLLLSGAHRAISVSFKSCVWGEGSYSARRQILTAARHYLPGGVGSVGYVEVAGHECWFVICYERFDCIVSKSI